MVVCKIESERLSLWCCFHFPRVSSTREETTRVKCVYVCLCMCVCVDVFVCVCIDIIISGRLCKIWMGRGVDLRYMRLSNKYRCH
jgi:hypothetical protein